ECEHTTGLNRVPFEMPSPEQEPVKAHPGFFWHLAVRLQYSGIAIVSQVRIPDALEGERADVRQPTRHRLGFPDRRALVRALLRLAGHNSTLSRNERQRHVIRHWHVILLRPPGRDDLRSG